MIINKYLVFIPGIILAFVLYSLSQGFNNIIGIEFFTKENLNFDKNFKKYRFFIGTKLDIKKQNSLSINYVFQKEVNVDSPLTQHILILKYNFSLKKI